MTHYQTTEKTSVIHHYRGGILEDDRLLRRRLPLILGLNRRQPHRGSLGTIATRTQSSRQATTPPAIDKYFLFIGFTGLQRQKRPTKVSL